MAKEFVWYGMTWDKLQGMGLDEFARYLPARQRRTIKRGLREPEKKLLAEVIEGKANIKTHCRDMIITPAFVGKQIKVHNGKEFVMIMVDKEMLGHRLGEFSQTRARVEHSAPGIGATRSSSSLSVK
jgi:small subunit ribosomal protein S19